jgi:hypothetical protein
LSETYAGSTHDIEIVKEEQWEFPVGVLIFQDTGFQGHNPKNAVVLQPEKKPKNKELSLMQKTSNKQISSIRVKVEHAIGLVKIYRIVKDTIRNWKYNFKDLIMEICCGLSNFKISLKT